MNVGGGRDVSLSLLEATELCRELTGNTVGVEASGEQRPGDVRIYLSDCRAAVRADGLAAATRRTRDPGRHARLDQGE